MANKIVVVPDLGGAETVDVIELCLAQGESVEVEGSLLVLESDKATMDVPSPSEGLLVKYLVAEGDTVKVGDPIAELDLGSAGSDAVAESEETAVLKATPEAQLGLQPESMLDEKENPQEVVESLTDQPSKAHQDPDVSTAIFDETAGANIGSDESDIYAGPAVRMLARELGVALSDVRGTGPRGRIVKDDVSDYVKQALNKKSSSSVSNDTGIPAVPVVDFSKFGQIETIKLTKIQKITAANMHRNWLNVPHVTQFDDADITDLEQFRKSLKKQSEARGIRISPVAFIIKAIAVALADNPVFNRSLAADGGHIVQKFFCNIGMAVDTDRGLVVPVIRNVDDMGIWDIAQAVSELANKAREGKLTPGEMQGGCFTLSSLGVIGGKGFTPIVNSPEAGILGVSKSEIKPVWDGNAFVPKLMLPMSLSYDHRLINGGDAGRFMTQVVALLSDVRLLAL
ncbi:MAG: 2-oxo acid dehydrogenase subunit E2 [Porticoccaceae bacterium]|nr:2-oxo acid dehydrogenase subunit E2 [Porticoccaceae bacterium]